MFLLLHLGSKLKFFLGPFKKNPSSLLNVNFIIRSNALNSWHLLLYIYDHPPNTCQPFSLLTEPWFCLGMNVPSLRDNNSLFHVVKKKISATFCQWSCGHIWLSLLKDFWKSFSSRPKMELEIEQSTFPVTLHIVLRRLWERIWYLNLCQQVCI